MPKQLRKCGVRGCRTRHYARGYCNKHYHRLIRHGDVKTVKKPASYREKHPAWKGDDASYAAVHWRLRTWCGRADTHKCACGKRASHWAFDEPTGFSTDLTRYTPKCASCHRRGDQAASMLVECPNS